MRGHRRYRPLAGRCCSASRVIVGSGALGPAREPCCCGYAGRVLGDLLRTGPAAASTRTSAARPAWRGHPQWITAAEVAPERWRYRQPAGRRLIGARPCCRWSPAVRHALLRPFSAFRWIAAAG